MICLNAIVCFIVFLSRIVTTRLRSPSPSPPTNIEYLVDPSLSSSTNSQLVSPLSEDNSKLLFREATSLRESTNSTISERSILMTGSQQSSVVQPLLTDLYQISMAYAYWKSNKHEEMATFDLYFRKNRMCKKKFFN
jgi:hypothetical protein